MPALNLLVIRSKDMDRLAEFYRHLGIDFVRHRHGNGPEHLAAELGSAVLEIYPLNSEADRTTSVRLGFTVPSVEAAVRQLRQKAVEVLQEPASTPWGKRAVVRDYEGHKVELCETVSVSTLNEVSAE